MSGSTVTQFTPLIVLQSAAFCWKASQDETHLAISIGVHNYPVVVAQIVEEREREGEAVATPGIPIPRCLIAVDDCDQEIDRLGNG
jgi:hypothetical protein